MRDSVFPTEEAPAVEVAEQRLGGLLDGRLVMLGAPDSACAAGYRVLRHRLAHRAGLQVVAVTSAEVGEGKTTCAANLALALREGERARVLLAEANLRHPSLAAMFGIEPPWCFGAQLGAGAARAPRWSVVEVLPGLHVAAVASDAPAGRALGDGRAASFAIDSLRRCGYDWLVIDTPPVLGSADVNLIEDATDGVVLVARAGRTSSRALAQAIEQLAPEKVIGVTLLDAP